MARRSFRKVPDNIRKAISDHHESTFLVGTARRIRKDELSSPKWSNLGIAADTDGRVSAPSAVVPPKEQGRYSRWNQIGRTIPRKDLPKISKIFTMEVPNFGDWGKGSHSITQIREVWQRETLYGQQLPIEIAIEEQDDDEILVGFTVDRVFEKEDFNDRELIFTLSLLQENVGSVNILPTDRTLAQWMSGQHVTWEFLPVGEWDRDSNAVLRKLRVRADSREATLVKERIDTIRTLGVSTVIVGTSGFSRYLGFKFRDDLVVFENIRYGNAAYVMYEDWGSLSTRSRGELLNLNTGGYDRVVHSSGWENRLRKILNAHGHPPEESDS
ncbi:hypothetical protein ABZ215_40105 [Amycolatopsis sp. NPDC006131]|uniref:hypothetical protein n=1 Tax=Amycolatopsis sp. NPDC006131 TaxID=3156731 RepID=UPI0033A2F49D